MTLASSDTETNAARLFIDYATYLVNALIVLLIIYIGHRVIKSAHLPLWLEVVGYLFFTLLSILIFILINTAFLAFIPGYVTYY